MMYASLANLHKGCRALALAALLTVAWAGSVLPVWAASPSTAPHTGLEGGQRHTFGPDNEGQRDPRYSGGGTMLDAYGNPVTPQEEEEAVRSRPRPGAYGAGRGPAPRRALPAGPETDAGWKFK